MPFAPLPGYAPKWKAVENAIKAKFPKTDTSGEPTPTSSGAFEVDINGTIVHSKLNGDGHVDSPEKMEKILAAKPSPNMFEICTKSLCEAPN